MPNDRSLLSPFTPLELSTLSISDHRLTDEQQAIFDSPGFGIALIKKGLLARCNRRFAEIFGRQNPVELIGRSTQFFLPESQPATDNKPGLAKPPTVMVRQEVLLGGGQGPRVWCSLTVQPVDAQGTGDGWVWVVEDIGARKQLESELRTAVADQALVHAELEQLVDKRTKELHRTVEELHDKMGLYQQAERHIQHLAHYDSLTDLPNRALLTQNASDAIAAAQSSNKPLAVMFLDLDRFKNVNDSLGHRVGDELLAALAVRLKSAVREKDTVSRLGGDEFMLVLPDTDADGAAFVAQKLMACTVPPFHVGVHELSISPSIGIAMYPRDGTDFDTLSQRADAAMYRAKRDGRNSYCFFTEEMQAHAARALLLENALRRALEREQMQLHYQPLVDLKTGRVTGAEALLRWRHPELGNVAPAEFIPVAEASGLVSAIGEWVLRKAVLQLKSWIDGGLPAFVIAVNLSAIQFRHLNLPNLITEILENADLPPEYLELELTEGAAMEDPRRAIAVMEDLHARGIRMSIDDFGTGYSSLSYLKRFKVYKLKIDQSFVRDITDDANDKAIVGAIIRMAGSLGLQTIAEGVETEAQLSFLREQGCDEAQGYLFSRPLAPAQFEAFMRDLQDHA